MREQWYVRAILSATIGMGVMAGLARSQEQVMVAPPGMVAVAPIPPSPIPQGPMLVPQGEIAEMYARQPHTRLGAWWHDRHPWKCSSHHNSPNCGSCKSEFTFVFGSCRAFFGDSCQKRPPLSRFLTTPGPGSLGSMGR